MELSEQMGFSHFIFSLSFGVICVSFLSVVCSDVDFIGKWNSMKMAWQDQCILLEQLPQLLLFSSWR